MFVTLPLRHRTTAVIALALMLIVGLPRHSPADTGQLVGQWVLDHKTSADAEDVFDGKLRRERFPTPMPRNDRSQRRSGVEQAQAEYWERIRQNEERRSTKDLRRLGTVYPLIQATRLDVQKQADGDGYIFVYDDDLPRAVRPNAAGRVFSARGDELVADSFGHTLSYREGETLVLETDPPEGGKFIERFTVRNAPRRLEYRATVDMRVLSEPVELVRYFVPD